MENIGGNLYTRHVKNLNHVHKDSKDLLWVIIILGTDVNGGETVFYDSKNMNDIGKRAHVLNHSHGKIIETFIIVSMFEMPTIKYWQNLGRIMEEAKVMIPK